MKYIGQKHQIWCCVSKSNSYCTKAWTFNIFLISVCLTTTDTSQILPIIPIGKSIRLLSEVFSSVLSSAQDAVNLHILLIILYTEEQVDMHDVQSCGGSSCYLACERWKWQVPTREADLRHAACWLLLCCSKAAHVQSSLEDFESFFFLTRPGYSVNMHRWPSYTLTGKAITLYCHTNDCVYRPTRDTVTALQTKVHKSTVY